MKLFEPLPFTVVYKGRSYPIKPFFDYVLRVFDIFQQKDLPIENRIDLALYVIAPKARIKESDKPEFLNAVFDLLMGKSEAQETQRSMDMVQDADLIFASFYQAYAIDLYKMQGKLHWLSFRMLLQNLPQDTPLMRVIEVRTKPLPKPTKYNQKEIATLMRLKSKYRLELTQEEREEQLQKGLAKIAMTLEAMANRKD